MPLLDAHITPLLIATASLAVVLGVLANLLAARILLNLGQSANDPVYRRSYRTRQPRVASPTPRARLSLVS